MKGAGELAMVACTLLYAIESLCAKLVELRLPSLELTAFRSVVAGALTLVVSVRTSPTMGWRERLLGPRGYFHLVAMRGCLGGIAFTLWYSSLHFIDVGEQTALLFTYPLIISTLAWPVVGEKPGFAIVIALVCGCTGTFLVSRGGKTPQVHGQHIFVSNEPILSDHTIGVTLTLLASLFTAITYLTIRVAGKYVSIYTLAFAFHFASACIGILGLIVGPQNPDWPRWNRELPLMCTVATTSLIGQPLLNFAFQVLPASRAASLNYLQVFFGFLLGAIFLHERSALIKIAGAVLITFGGICVAGGKNPGVDDDAIPDDRLPLTTTENEVQKKTTIVSYKAINPGANGGKTKPTTPQQPDDVP